MPQTEAALPQKKQKAGGNKMPGLKKQLVQDTQEPQNEIVDADWDMEEEGEGSDSGGVGGGVAPQATDLALYVQGGLAYRPALDDWRTLRKTIASVVPGLQARLQ